MSRIPIALIGIGKIARDQHIPTIAASPDFELAAVVTRNATVEGVASFDSIGAMMAAVPQVAAIGVCTPPRDRLPLVREAIAHGLDVLIEKPPAATLGEAEAIAASVVAAGRVIYASWHSRHAPAVQPARQWLTGRRIVSVSVAWKEDVRVWHPGQEWIWEAGIGVFDPGINALSVITAILPEPLLLLTSALRFPANRAAPIAATLELRHGDAPVSVEFDFDQQGPQSWDIVVVTDGGTLTLSHGASRLAIDGVSKDVDQETEYARLYSHFAAVLRAARSDVDLAPLRLVADAFMLGTRTTVDAFAF